MYERSADNSPGGCSPELRALVESVVQGLGLDLWGVDYPPHRGGGLLRVLIDTPDGVDVETCARVSRLLGHVLDVEDLIPEAYRLEVSSPGLDRPLYTWEQFERYCGQRLKLSLRKTAEQPRRMTGRLIGTAADRQLLHFETDSGLQRNLQLGDIEKANLVPEFTAGWAGD